MLRRRVRSALYIDFENVPLPPDQIANWLAWLEDGAFDPKGRARRFIQKRVYWNSHAEKNRDLFLKHGFAPVLIGKFSGLKNGADIRMAMDLVEATYRRSEIDEFILLTGDSDFVPVLDRLREKTKRTAIVATEHRPNIHTTYALHADIVIPSRRLAEAALYRRAPVGFWRRLVGGRQGASGPMEPATAARTGRTATANPTGQIGPPQRPARPPSTRAPEPTTPIDLATVRVAALLVANPKNFVAQKRIMAELERVPGFRKKGNEAFLGYGTYKTLMRELSRRDARIRVVEQPGGGTGVVHMPIPPPLPVTDSVQRSALITREPLTEPRTEEPISEPLSEPLLPPIAAGRRPDSGPIATGPET